MSPNSDNVTEFTEMNFTCRGNVGRPAGTFQWFTIADTTVDVTDQVKNKVIRRLWACVWVSLCVCVCDSVHCSCVEMIVIFYDWSCSKCE